MGIKRLAAPALGGMFCAALLVAMAPNAAQGAAATPVRIANPAANPALTRDVDNAARQAITLQTFSLNGVFFLPTGITPFAVPAGKRLVIEYVSGQFTTANGQHISSVSISGGINFSAGQDVVSDFVQPNLVTTGNFNIYIVAQKTWLYVDAGNFVQADVALTSGSNANSLQFTLRGYLVDCTGGCPFIDAE